MRLCETVSVTVRMRISQSHIQSRSNWHEQAWQPNHFSARSFFFYYLHIRRFFSGVSFGCQLDGKMHDGTRLLLDLISARNSQHHKFTVQSIEWMNDVLTAPMWLWTEQADCNLPYNPANRPARCDHRCCTIISCIATPYVRRSCITQCILFINTVYVCTYITNFQTTFSFSHNKFG